ncbi:hypothetical protein Z043_120925 [Scleropages formosus]|uniref:Uncharacterized protein n=1 Tax=Scleropages formosus TaxID=113540 RepID=A0A0P7WIJ6_SCLFO|nr:hypothetical protein Z043_120925 [Scleropages formosus]
MSILERLEQMERRMAEMAGHHQQGSGGGGGGSDCGGGGVGGNGGSNSQSQTFRGMTLLHLAAGQGYATLIQTLIKWRTKHADSIDLELEVDPLNVDHFSCTPLMWACALGHLEAAVVLYKWDCRALAIPDSLGRLPLTIARSRGHTKLADRLEQLQRERHPPSTASPPHTPHLSFSPPPETSASDSWMVAWNTDGGVSAGGQKGSTAGATGSNSDLRRPRSEPSGYHGGEGQRDVPLAKKHKPNPELQNAQQPDKAASVPLSLESQQLHKLSTTIKTPLPETPCPDLAMEGGGYTGGVSHTKQCAMRGLGGGIRWSPRELYSGGAPGRKVAGGKEKLASRLRQREPASALVASERAMVGTELLSYREDLENQSCLTHIDDLQVNMMTLAEHIIEATPERIKRENFVAMETVPLDSTGVSTTMSWLASYLGDMEHLSSIIHLRSLYSEPLTPSSNPSLSPCSSPLGEGPFDSPHLHSPADWAQFLGSSNNKVEQELAQLALSDPEQRELYEAARLVQTAFRKVAHYGNSRKSQPLSFSDVTGSTNRSGLLTKKQDQAARKIMRFLRRCRHRVTQGDKTYSLEEVQPADTRHCHGISKHSVCDLQSAK